MKGFTDKLEGQNNPALTGGFIGPDITGKTDKTHKTDNAGDTQPKVETKTKRLNLVMRPSLLVDIGKIATMQQSSVNDLINRALEAYSGKEAETITEYDKVFKKGKK